MVKLDSGYIVVLDCKCKEFWGDMQIIFGKLTLNFTKSTIFCAVRVKKAAEIV